MGTTNVEINISKFSEKTKEFYQQIDILKGVMIFLVIFDHTIPWDYKNKMGVALWERISIPIFLIIMGFNMGLSFKRRGETSLRKLYSWNYFKKKFWRYIIPFALLYLVSTLVGLSINGVDALSQYKINWNTPHLFIGIILFYGPGNWFLPVIFWSILIMPLLYKGFSGKVYWSIITLVLCFVVELALQLGIFFIFDPRNIASWHEYDIFIYFYRFVVTTPFFMLSAIGLGMWFSRNHNIYAKQNIVIWILFPLSLLYLIWYQFYNFRFKFIFGDYNLFVFPYSAFLFLIVMKILPKNSDNLFLKGVRTIGRSTYHILLTQILYFAITISLYGDHYCASIMGINQTNFLICMLYLILNWILCIPIGVSWWYGETKLRNYLLSKKKRKDRITEK
ncbi:MAG: acyltransferase family protein [Candidatus Thorarchaeota archaeon]